MARAAYDSDAGRAYAAVITALMSAQAYKTSAMLAQVRGAFDEYRVNREAMLRVIQKHARAVDAIDRRDLPEKMVSSLPGSYGRKPSNLAKSGGIVTHR